MANDDYKQWYIHGLQALQSAAEAGSKAAEAVSRDLSDPELQAIARDGSRTAEQNARTIERLLQQAGGQPSSMRNVIMDGILEGTRQMMDASQSEDVRNAAGAAAAQVSLHYFISAYGTLGSTAKHLGMTDEAREFKRMTDELKAFDQRYTEVAEGKANRRAAA